MISIQALHREAMDMAEMALMAKHQGQLDKADDLFRQAYDKEKESAEFFQTLMNEEPTRSVFYRSAASLAVQCQEFREAERLIATALSGEPPVEIAEELRELLENLYGNGIEGCVKRLKIGMVGKRAVGFWDNI